jgi:hypothetical protein
MCRIAHRAQSMSRGEEYLLEMSDHDHFNMLNYVSTRCCQHDKKGKRRRRRRSRNLIWLRWRRWNRVCLAYIVMESRDVAGRPKRGADMIGHSWRRADLSASIPRARTLFRLCRRRGALWLESPSDKSPSAVEISTHRGCCCPHQRRKWQREG